jgi:hypothetical protein
VLVERMRGTHGQLQPRSTPRLFCLYYCPFLPDSVSNSPLSACTCHLAIKRPLIPTSSSRARRSITRTLHSHLRSSSSLFVIHNVPRHYIIPSKRVLTIRPEPTRQLPPWLSAPIPRPEQPNYPPSIPLPGFLVTRFQEIVVARPPRRVQEDDRRDVIIPGEISMGHPIDSAPRDAGMSASSTRHFASTNVHASRLCTLLYESNAAIYEPRDFPITGASIIRPWSIISRPVEHDPRIPYGAR